MPESVSLYPESADALIRLVANIETHLQGGRRVLLSFAESTELTVASVVYLYSQIDILHLAYGRNSVAIDARSLRGVARLYLRASGLLLLANGGPIPNGDILPILTGVNDDNFDLIVEFLITKAIIEDQLMEDDVAYAEKLVTDAISEAMLNVKYHAYPSNDYKPWWFTAAIFHGHLNIAMCDRGVGIPETLPRQSWWELIRPLITLGDDATMIRSAMEYTRTSHAENQGRGLGTRSMQNLVLEAQKGHMTVISGQGHYRLSGETSEELLSNLRYNVRGTVVQWRVPLTTKNGHDDERAKN